LLFSLAIPKLNEHMVSARIETLYATPGAELAVGAKIADISVDLSDVFPQDCPPTSYHRIVLREKLWLRQVLVTAGQYCAPGGCIAIFSNEAHESLESGIARPARVMVAAIFFHPDMWSGTHV
jgi:hypothetical protein